LLNYTYVRRARYLCSAQLRAPINYRFSDMSSCYDVAFVIDEKSGTGNDRSTFGSGYVGGPSGQFRVTCVVKMNHDLND
jgi:hypothetical protein